ncbi:carbohydrate-binding domain-containing protein [Actinomyces bowdenii]|uniref:carbohydrate-binding domain-containing protein n=1 Tax=Actinomyces bowdenii TaxID=131109 RepID=UPI001ABCCB0A|nr:carbohydrate-binding domain-containing protein [Actinomyces bowdenii]MBO3724060.1 carbohydrate-binding domain-containing protein [Actinomyces bowdenii]
MITRTLLHRRTTGPIVLLAALSLAALSLAAGCSASGTATDAQAASAGQSGSASSASQSSTASESSGTAWTTISEAIASASAGATTADILAANAQVEQASTPQDDAGTVDASGATTIALSGTAATVQGEGASAEGSMVTITEAGTYVVSGQTSNGRIVVAAPGAQVRIVLDGASITSSDGPAIDIQDAGEAIVVLAEGSTNALADGAVYADTSSEAPTAALFSSDTLTLTGTGSLSVTGSHRDGISSKNGLIITGGTTIEVTAADDGLRGKDYVAISSGRLTINAGGDAVKSSEDTDETKGFVSLGEAWLTLVSGDDGITAATDVTVAGTTLEITAGGGQAAAVPQEDPGTGAQSGEESQDAAPSPKGISAGVSYTQDSGTLTLNTADEGLQAPFVTISGGELSVTSGDDGINASNGDHVIEGHESADSESDDGSVLTISGGAVQVGYAASDGIDSNGSAHVTGGRVVIGGSTGSMDGAIDANGATTLVGLTGAPAVAEGDTITLSGASEWSLTSAISAADITVLGLEEGREYTVSSTSGGSATATASALSAGMGGPMAGGQAPGGAGGPGGRSGQEPGGQAPEGQGDQGSSAQG